ncbi:MAG: rod shape-determining protein MreD [Spirochaetaceae bacterium]|nr:MAG: rod shape-determining protein MreD [Spirochaetaceae bacterium]
MITLGTTLLGATFALLQSTWLSGWFVLGARPDLVLIVLTYHSYRTGVQRGQISGFIVGLVEDGLSVSPPGFHAVIRLVHSAIIGATRQSVTTDPIVTPVTLTAIAFGLKTLAVLLVGSILRLERIAAGVFSLATLMEGLFTIVLAPAGFWLLRRIFDRYVRGLR